MHPCIHLLVCNCYLVLMDLHTQAEGIFRINADNGQEEFVRNQLNAGVVPVGIDVHCLAGLIKVSIVEISYEFLVNIFK